VSLGKGYPQSGRHAPVIGYEEQQDVRLPALFPNHSHIVFNRTNLVCSALRVETGHTLIRAALAGCDLVVIEVDQLPLHTLLSPPSITSTPTPVSKLLNLRVMGFLIRKGCGKSSTTFGRMGVGDNQRELQLVQQEVGEEEKSSS
jgi:hypothetical protein